MKIDIGTFRIGRDIGHLLCFSSLIFSCLNKFCNFFRFIQSYGQTTQKHKIMNAALKILAFSLLFTTSYSHAGNGEKAFRKLIESKIFYPLHLSQKVETEVYVEFTVLENAEIRIDKMDCANEEVCEAITLQLKNLKFNPNDSEIINKTFAYKFKLEVEE